MKAKKHKWSKGDKSYIDGRITWFTFDHDYGLVVNPMAYGKNKWHVGYNYISNTNHVDLANSVTKKRAMSIAKKFMRTH